jgi:hypothetical protein
MQEALRHAYESLTTKPISLLEAIAEDAPIGSSSRGAAASVPRLPTTADGVSATMLSGGPHSRSPTSRMRVAMVGGVGLLVTLAAVAGGVRLHATSDRRAEPAAERSVASAPLVGEPLSSASAAVAASAALVVPLERLPIAPANPVVPLAKGGPHISPEAVHLSVNLSPTASPEVPRAVSARSVAPVDPYATRH